MISCFAFPIVGGGGLVKYREYSTLLYYLDLPEVLFPFRDVDNTLFFRSLSISLLELWPKKACNDARQENSQSSDTRL